MGAANHLTSYTARVDQISAVFETDVDAGYLESILILPQIDKRSTEHTGPILQDTHQLTDAEEAGLEPLLHEQELLGHTWET